MTDLTQIPLFALAERRLAWIGKRQDVLAENVANADTPGWKSHDVKPFADVLRDAPGGITLVRTNPAHLSGAGSDSANGTVLVPGEQAPDGNTVALDRELMKLADTDATHAFVTNVAQSYLGMFRTALGK